MAFSLNLTEGSNYKKYLKNVNSYFNGSNKRQTSSQSAFSVAEAMITLLIVSIALAAAAPLMSRSIKNTNNNNNDLQRQINELRQEVQNNVPENANNNDDLIAQITNLQQQINDLRTEVGQNVPNNTVAFFNLANCPTGWTAVNANWNGRFIRIANGTRTVGSLEADAVGRHSHDIAGYTWIGQGGGCPSGNCLALVYTSNGTWGMNHLQAETRPVNVALTACRRQR